MNRKLPFGSALIAFLAVSMSVWAQGDVLWKKNFGGLGKDEYESVTAVSDGVIAVGCSRDWSFGNGDWEGVEGNGNYDAIIVKYDNAGNVVWKKNFGGSSFDYFYAVATMSDGVIAVGDSHRFGDGDWEGVTGKGNGDAIIVKYDNAGNVVWKKNFGGSDVDEYSSVTAVADGIVAIGYSWSTSFGNGDWAGVTGKGGDDAIIVKYDNTGDVVWKKNFGGSGRDEYRSVRTVADGIVAVGYSGSTSFGNGDWTGVVGKGDSDAIIVKYDNAGNIVWKKNFGGNDGDGFYEVMAISDGVIAVGYSIDFGAGDWNGTIGKGSNDAIIVKYDNDGNVIWKKNFGGSGADYYNSVTAVSDGIVAAGYSGSDSFGNGDWAGITGKGADDAIIVKYSTNPTSIADNSQDATLRIYPNPTNGQIHITGFDGRDAMNGVCTDVQIFDMYGRNVLVAAVETGRAPSLQQQPTTTLDISHLPDGVYFLRIGGKTMKIVKINNN